MTQFFGIKHIALPAFDLERAIGFYTKYLGFSRYYPADPDWTMVYSNGTTLSFLKREASGQDQKNDKDSSAGHPQHVGIVVSSMQEVDELFEQLKNDGHNPFSLKKHRDGSYGFYLKDSESNAIEVIFIPLAPFLPAFKKVLVYALLPEQLHDFVGSHFPFQDVECFTEGKSGLEQLKHHLSNSDQAEQKMVFHRQDSIDLDLEKISAETFLYRLWSDDLDLIESGLAKAIQGFHECHLRV